MALITSKECGKEISDKAKSCPSCGFPLSEVLQEAPRIAPTNKDSFLSIEKHL